MKNKTKRKGKTKKMKGGAYRITGMQTSPIGRANVPLYENNDLDNHERFIINQIRQSSRIHNGADAGDPGAFDESGPSGAGAAAENEQVTGERAFPIIRETITNIKADPNDPAPRATFAHQLRYVCSRAQAENEGAVNENYRELLRASLDAITELCHVIPNMYQHLRVAPAGRAEGTSKIVTWHGNIPRVYKFTSPAKINKELFHGKRLPFNASRQRVIAIREMLDDAMYTRFLSALLPDLVLSVFDPDAINAQPGRLPRDQRVEGQLLRVFVQPLTQPIISGDPLLVPAIIDTIHGLLHAIPGVFISYLDGKLGNFGKLSFQGYRADSIVCIDAGPNFTYAVPPAYSEYFRQSALTVAFCSIGYITADQLQQILAVISIAEMEQCLVRILSRGEETEIRTYASNFFRTLGLNDTAEHTRIEMPIVALSHYCRDYYDPPTSKIDCRPDALIRRFRRHGTAIGLIR